MTITSEVFKLVTCSFISSRSWAWVVTSRAVVGSSAISILGIAGQAHGDHDSLAHTAAELVRIIIDSAFGIRYAHLF